MRRGLKPESLSKALSPEGKLEFATVLKLVRVLGIKLHAEPVSELKPYTASFSDGSYAPAFSFTAGSSATWTQV